MNAHDPEFAVPDHEFSWLHDSEDIAVAEQSAIAVYQNPAGDIVIRQRAAGFDHDDSLVIVNSIHATSLARALLQAAGEVFTEVTPFRTEKLEEVA